MNRFLSILLASFIFLCFNVSADEPQPAEDAKPKVEAKKLPAKIKVQPAQAMIQIGGFGNAFGNNVRVRTEVDRNDNVERFVLLAPRGPIVVEVALMLDGQPYRTAREKLIDEMMKAADTDNDGKATWQEAMDNPAFMLGRTSTRVMLPIQMPAANNKVQPKKADEKEADDKKADDKEADDKQEGEDKDNKEEGEKKEEKKEEVKNPQPVQIRILQIGANGQNPGDKDAMIEHFDANKDGIVDRSEARLMLAQTSGGAAFSLNESYNRLAQPDVKAVLDTNNDGKVSKDELEAAPDKLKSRDTNDNDLLEAAELGGNGGIRVGNGQVIMARAFGAAQANRSQVGHLIGPTSDPTTLFEALKKKYADADQKITAKSFLLSSDSFTQLDTNKNGELDADEVKGFDTVKPHISLQSNLGESKLAGIALKSIAKELGNEDVAKDKFSEELTLSLPDVQLRFAATAGTVRRVDYSQTAKANVDRYDTNKDGFIEGKEMEKVNAVLKQQFDRWDINSDGKVFAEEITAWYERQQAPARSRLMATVGEQGPSLFGVLDTSGDKRLSLREMKTAATQLLSKDKNKDGEIGLDEIPVEIQVAFGSGTSGARLVFNEGVRQPAAPPKAGDSSAPTWFTRMDRNGDGDVTLREFLGNETQFKEIDTNGDGFIELQEAQAAKLPDAKEEK